MKTLTQKLTDFVMVAVAVTLAILFFGLTEAEAWEPEHPFLNPELEPRVMAWECGDGGPGYPSDCLRQAIDRWAQAVCGNSPCEGYILVGFPQPDWVTVGSYVEFRYDWMHMGHLGMTNMGWPTGNGGLYNHMGCFLDLSCDIRPTGS